MKTWEKIYWGIIGILFVFTLLPLFGSEELIKVEVQGKYQLYSKGTYFFYDLLGFLIIFVPIWLVVRLIMNKGWSEKQERERERERTNSPLF